MLCGASLCLGLLSSAGLYYLADYQNIVELTERLSNRFGTKVFVHTSLLKQAVDEGDSVFFDLCEMKNQETLAVFEHLSAWQKQERANQFFEDIQSLLNKTGSFRSKLLSLDPQMICAEEIIRSDAEGCFHAVEASRNYDIALTLFLIQAGKFVPVNDNGESVIFAPSDNQESFYIYMLSRHIKKLLNQHKDIMEDDGQNIFQHLVKVYSPDMDTDALRRYIYYAKKGGDTINKQNHKGQTVFHLVQHVDLCQFLLNLDRCRNFFTDNNWPLWDIFR